MPTSVEVSLRTAKLLALTAELVPAPLGLPAAGQGVAVEQLVLGPVLLVGKGGHWGLGRLEGAEARGHPTVVRMAEDQTLLGAHLGGFH